MDTETSNTVDTTGQEVANSGKTFTQGEVDILVRERLDRQKRSLEAQQTKTKDETDAAKLKEQHEYKTLAEQRETQVKELEPYKATAEKYGAALTKLLETERKALPSHIVSLLDKMDAADQLEWIAQNKAELFKAQAPNLNASDKGATVSKAERVESNVTALRQRGGYSGF